MLELALGVGDWPIFDSDKSRRVAIRDKAKAGYEYARRAMQTVLAASAMH